MNIFSKALAFMKKKLEPRPGTDLQQVKFRVEPRIIKRGQQYLLQYQVAKKEDMGLQLTHIVYARKGQDKGYYFFSIPIGHQENLNLMERDVSADGFTTFAKKNAIYWLNRDGSEVQLPVHEHQGRQHN